MKTAICVIIKDEQDYLKEWLDHHLNLGIDEIFLYEDYGSISHSHITKPYGDRVHLSPIDIIFQSDFKFIKKYNNYGSLIQEKLFDWFLNTYRSQFDWILFNDIDEFLILKQPLHELLEEYDDKPAILLPWRWFGASGHIKKPKGKVMDNFTKPSPTSFDYDWAYKSFLNCNRYTYWEKPIHKVMGGVYPTNEWGDCKAFLNHYFTKSWEEWKWKLFSRGDTFPGNRRISQFFNINKDLLDQKDNLMLDMAIENANKLGFNENIHYEDYFSSEKRFIHFCWFGWGEFNEINKKCIESWKKYLSDDFIVCLWNENSFDHNSI